MNEAADRGPHLTALVAAALAAVLTVPTLLSAQDPDFLFRSPVATVSLFGGWGRPGEGGDLFEFTREQLTVSEGDFSSPVVLAELAVRATDRLDLTVAVEHAWRTVHSEMEDWVWEDGEPIRQSTQFDRTRLLGGVKVYLLPRGRQIGEYAWIPTAWSPYLGGGAGVSWYEFVQEGDFVDFQTLDIFEAELSGNGSGAMGHALAGLQWTLGPRFLLRGEVRYLWGSGSVSGDAFDGFNDVDLSGARALVGVAVRL